MGAYALRLDMDDEMWWALHRFPGFDGYSEDELRAAWALFGDQLIEDHLAQRTQAGFIYAGHRPWAYWRFEVDRPDLDVSQRLGELERVRFLAEHGELSEAEIAELVRRGVEAEARIDADAELRGPVLGDPDEGDRLTVRIAQAAEGAEP
jgi:hypothetical protein